MNKFSLAKVICLVFVVCTATAICCPAQTFSTISNFNSFNGSDPFGTLAQGLNGDFYSTTLGGGANSDGTVFLVTPTGTLTVRHSFDKTNGSAPNSGVVLGADRNFYGVTQGGGANNQGTIFKITPSGHLTTLYSFCPLAGCADGDDPQGTLVEATNGNFYGTTYGGSPNNVGTIFEISRTGTFTSLHSFCSEANCGDGEIPQQGLVQANNGNLYGTAPYGGTNSGGVIYQLTPSGTFSVIYSFCAQTNCADGSTPYAALILAANGNLYGTTAGGGTNNNGTVFEVTTAGQLTTLYTFCPNTGCADGANPEGPLVQATDGKLYGMTFAGGANGKGAIFAITPSGTFTTLYSFCSQTSCDDGEGPYLTGLLQATNGTLYGTTPQGGNKTYGTVFSLAVGLGPFVKTVPTAGRVGAAVTILGNGLTGTTAVSFNGTAATFTVVSDTEITTTVPTGATTGRVQVTTPTGTLNSNVRFRVL